MFTMLTIFIALLSGMLGFIMGVHLMTRQKVTRFAMAQSDLPFAYRLIAGQILSGEIPEDGVWEMVRLFQSKGGHVAVVGDSIEFFLTPGLGKRKGRGDLVDFLRLEAEEARELAPVKEGVA